MDGTVPRLVGMNAPTTIDVSSATFDEAVLAASRDKPVIVDFWAPWCGPCRQLGPVLEGLAADAEGAWTLAKLNTDENQDLAARYNIRGIPAVKAFVNGKVVEEFTGALPKSAVQQFLARIQPPDPEAAARKKEELLARVGGLDALKARIENDENDHDARIELGRLLGLAEDWDGAFTQWFEVIQRDAGPARDRARTEMVAAFGEVGRGELTDGWRRKLANALYS